MANIAVSDVHSLLRKADSILRNSSIYEESKEFDNFKDLVGDIKQKHNNWLLKAQSFVAEDVVGDSNRLPGGDSRTWQSVEEATGKAEEEVARLSKLRLSAGIRSLMCNCCFSKCVHRVHFPEDLMDSFQQIVHAFEPHKRIEELVTALKSPGDDPAALDNILKELAMELAERQQIGLGGKKRISLMHRAAFAGMESLLLVLMRMTGRVSNINSVDSDGQTPLHYATIAGQTEAARLLLSQPKLRANEEDFYNRTALQIAVETKRKDIEKILLERADVQQYVDRLASDRQVFVDAANAILVGAALIASITFQGWLQPPLGFTSDYNYQQPYPAPPETYESFAAVNQSISLRVFFTLNSLAFFFALATVIAGAGCVLPMPDAFIKDQVKLVRKALVMTSILLVVSIVFVLGAFAAAGYASLPPSTEYTKNITVTTAVGGTVCLSLLVWFMGRLYRIRPIWLRAMEEDMFGRAGNKKRTERDLYFIS
ncbi:unnamed protein product [Calypogeia fissa]